MATTGGGNVGIGTASPGHKLDVNGNAKANNLYVDSYIYHNGDTNTYIRFVGGDDLQLVAGGRQMLRMDEGTDPDRLRFVTDSNWTDSNGDWNMSGNVTVGGHIYGKSVNNQYSNLYRFGGIYFTWDSDSYGTNTHHSIRSTYGDSYGDNLTMNSFNHIRFNIDSNNNNSGSVFEVGANTTGTGNVIFQVNDSGNVSFSGNLDLATSTKTAGVRMRVDSTTLYIRNDGTNA
jgi:hypothetical protein